MKQKFLFFIFFFLSVLGVSAQGEATNWFFGSNTGLNFNDLRTVINAVINGEADQTLAGVPAAVTGPINTLEGCFSISDPEGNFLFASDGIEVYNGYTSVDIMENGTGLMGHPSANESGVMIPRPETPGHYYIVTAPCRYTSEIKELFYSEVDFTVTNTNGKGTVLENGTYGTLPSKLTKLNLPDYDENSAYENIAAVSHANGKDFWLVHWCRGYYYVWLITKDGFNGVEPYSKISLGFDLGKPVNDGAGNGPGGGQIKFSSDGQYIISTTGMDKRIIIGKFNNNTGEIEILKIRTISSGYYLYSVEMSRNSKYIYVSDINRASSIGVFVFSRTGFIDGTESLKKTTAVPTLLPCGLQTGPDNRIYISNRGTASGAGSKDLSVILDPDDGGTEIATIFNYYTNSTQLGLPNFVASFFHIGEIETNPVLPTCINKEVAFSVQISIGTGDNRINKLAWDFGDGSPIITETDMDKYIFSQKHTYAKPGVYTLKLTPYNILDLEETDKIKTLEVTISRCVMPVNPNIHLYSSN